jgi:hypothetical protein
MRSVAQTRAERMGRMPARECPWEQPGHLNKGTLPSGSD